MMKWTKKRSIERETIILCIKKLCPNKLTASGQYFKTDNITSGSRASRRGGERERERRPKNDNVFILNNSKHRQTSTIYHLAWTEQQEMEGDTDAGATQIRCTFNNDESNLPSIVSALHFTSHRAADNNIIIDRRKTSTVQFSFTQSFPFSFGSIRIANRIPHSILFSHRLLLLLLHSHFELWLLFRLELLFDYENAIESIRDWQK